MWISLLLITFRCTNAVEMWYPVFDIISPYSTVEILYHELCYVPIAIIHDYSVVENLHMSEGLLFITILRQCRVTYCNWVRLIQRTCIYFTVACNRYNSFLVLPSC